MDKKVVELLKVGADPETILANLPEVEVWRFSSALIALCGYRAAVAGRPDIEQVCARFINDLADITGLPHLGEKPHA